VAHQTGEGTPAGWRNNGREFDVARTPEGREDSRCVDERIDYERLALVLELDACPAQPSRLHGHSLPAGDLQYERSYGIIT
jgi:hypothetical protein